MTDEEARAHYEKLSDYELTPAPDPAVAAFWAELTAQWPDIDDVPEEHAGDLDFSPWASASDVSGGHVLMSCVWSRSEAVGEVVHALAEKHGVALFDPQTGVVHYADTPARPARPWWKFW